MLGRIFRMLVLGATTASAAASQGTTHHVFGDGIFSLDAPAMFTLNAQSKNVQLTTQNDIASITASAYAKQDGSLEEFCQYRFSSVQEWYKPTSDPINIETPMVKGLMREYEGVWPGETSPTYYVVSCLSTRNTFISIGIVTTRKHFESNRPMYLAILNSIKGNP